MWNLLIIDPMVNALLWLYNVLGNNYILSIILLTILIRLLTFPLTWQQQRSAKSMQDLQPELQKLQKKYAEDKEKLSQKTMELYREAGVSPLGGCLPTVIQLPILIGLYQAITQTLGASPTQLLSLSQHIYRESAFAALIPLNSQFLWMDLGRPDPYFVLTVLVVVSTWLQQKLLTTPSADPQQQAMTRQMQLMMPLMIGWFSITVPSGLSIYWVASNIIGFVQFAAMGRVNLINQLFGREKGAKTAE
jgi:YidC/Oxa1 family membrane protein insertase